MKIVGNWTVSRGGSSNDQTRWRKRKVVIGQQTVKDSNLPERFFGFFGVLQFLPSSVFAAIIAVPPKYSVSTWKHRRDEAADAVDIGLLLDTWLDKGVPFSKRNRRATFEL